MPRAALHPDEIARFRRQAAGAAMHLFATHGYEAVTMRAVGDALGVSAMTAYRYMSGKAELFALVRTEAFRRFADWLEAALAKGGGDALARLERLKRAYIAFALDEPDAYRIMFELRQDVSDAPPALGAEGGRSFAALHRTVAEAVAEGALVGDPLTLAHLLWANTHGLVSLHLAGKLVLGRSLHKLAGISHELVAFQPPPSPRSKQRKRKP